MSDDASGHSNGSARSEPVATAPDTPSEATTASGWFRPPATEVMELPSGNVARLRRPSVLAMMKTGQIPNPLIEAAAAVASGTASPDYQRTAELIDFLTAAAFVEPRVVLEGPTVDGELHIDEISDADKKFVVAWAQSEARAIDTFHGERAGVEGGGDGGDVRGAPEHAAVA